MKRPSVQAMDEIEEILQDIGFMETAISKLRNRLGELPGKMRQEISEQSDRVEAARYLYWMIQEVPSKAIGEGLLKVQVHEMNRLLGPKAEKIECDRCHILVKFRNRSHLNQVLREVKRYKKIGNGKDLKDDFKILCGPCSEVVREVYQREYEDECARRNARLEELRSMTYSDYLNTPEWLYCRLEHFRCTGNRCQVCNKNRLLNVYRRTDERRGQELFTDLLTLCKKCHDLLQKESRLVAW